MAHSYKQGVSSHIIRGGVFVDDSLLLLNGTSIVAVILGHVDESDDKKVFYSHNGTTFGGIVLSKNALNINYLEKIFEITEQYFKDNNINKVELKQTGQIFFDKDTTLLDYYFYLNGYNQLSELGYYIDFDNYNDEIITNYSKSRRRDYRYSLKKDFKFKELITDEEIKDFYFILCDNYKKFNKSPIHTLDKLLDFKFKRLTDETKFYGVYEGDELIAGGMIFLFNKLAFHTQYLAVKQDKTHIFCNEFLYTNLIEEARKEGYRYISFGTSTLNKGKILNKNLAQFKEGFGTSCFINKTFTKSFGNKEVSYE